MEDDSQFIIKVFENAYVTPTRNVECPREQQERIAEFATMPAEPSHLTCEYILGTVQWDSNEWELRKSTTVLVSIFSLALDTYARGT